MYYIVILFSVILLAWQPRKINKDYKLIAGLYIFIVICMGVFRDTTIGTDTALDGGYHDIWMNPFGGLDYVEKGFQYIVAAIKWLVPSYYFFYGFFFFLTVIVYCRVAKNLKCESCVLIAVMFLSLTLVQSFNIFRQLAGLCFACLAYTFFILNKKNVLLYEISILLLMFLFHRSLAILIIIPIFEIPKVQLFLDHELILWGLFVGAIVLSSIGRDYINSLILMSEGVFGDRADHYVEFQEMYGEMIERGHGVVSDVITGSLYLLISRGRRDSIFYIGFLGLILNIFAGSFLGTIARLFLNLSVFMMLYWAKYWFEFSKGKKLFSMNNIVKFLRVIFWITTLYYSLLTNETMAPYKSYLFQ